MNGRNKPLVQTVCTRYYWLSWFERLSEITKDRLILQNDVHYVTSRRCKCVYFFLLKSENGKRTLLGRYSIFAIFIYSWVSPPSWRMVVIAGHRATIEKSDLNRHTVIYPTRLRRFIHHNVQPAWTFREEIMK